VSPRRHAPAIQKKQKARKEMEKKYYLKPELEVLETETESILAGTFDWRDDEIVTPIVNPEPGEEPPMPH
jgi:hypothetical protein